MNCKNCNRDEWIPIVEGFSYQCGYCGRVDVDGEQLNEEESQAYLSRRKLPKSWGEFGGFYKQKQS